MTHSPLRAAVIGLGVGARHAEGYATDSRTRLVAICDQDQERLSEVAALYPNVRQTTEAGYILKDPDIDVVSIASYDTFHAQQVLRALAHGKHVYVEKPICLFDEEFEQIDAAISEHPGLKLSSNLVLRRSPGFRAILDRLGEVGQVYHMEGDYNYGRLHKLTEGWRGRIPFYSVSHGGAIHLIDLILWLTGFRVKEVVASGSQIASQDSDYRFPDMISALLRFENGATAKVGSNYGSVTPHHHQLQIYGTEGTIIHTEAASLLYRTRDEDSQPAEEITSEAGEGKIHVLRSFISEIVEGDPADVSAADVMDAMAVSLAIERSLKVGGWEPVRYGRTTRQDNQHSTSP